VAVETLAGPQPDHKPLKRPLPPDSSTDCRHSHAAAALLHPQPAAPAVRGVHGMRPTPARDAAPPLVACLGCYGLLRGCRCGAVIADSAWSSSKIAAAIEPLNCSRTKRNSRFLRPEMPRATKPPPPPMTASAPAAPGVLPATAAPPSASSRAIVAGPVCQSSASAGAGVAVTSSSQSILDFFLFFLPIVLRWVSCGGCCACCCV